MTPDQQAAADNALMRRLKVTFGKGKIPLNPDGPEAAERIKALRAEIARKDEALKLWRSLVNEGGVPRYTITPGAALNTVVTITDAALAPASKETDDG